METSFEINGIDLLKRELAKLAPRVATRTLNTGVTKAASRMRTYLRQDAPKVTGRLRKAIKSKKYRTRGGNVGRNVGLYNLYYYKTLEFHTKRGKPMNPFLIASIERHKKEIVHIMLQSSLDAIQEEAGKIYAKTRRSI